MIRVTHFNGNKYYLNAEIIVSVEATPDTVVTLLNNQKVLVREKAEEVVRKIIEYRRLVYNPDLDYHLGE